MYQFNCISIYFIQCLHASTSSFTFLSFCPSISFQILPLKVGRSTLASTWLLENPGHVINKFNSFVRVVYILGDDGDHIAPSPFPTRSHTHEKSEKSKEIRNTLEKEGEVRGGEKSKTLPPLRSELHQELESIHTHEESEGDHSSRGKRE